jgi:hypothetical protein
MDSNAVRYFCYAFAERYRACSDAGCLQAQAPMPTRGPGEWTAQQREAPQEAAQRERAGLTLRT